MYIYNLYVNTLGRNRLDETPLLSTWNCTTRPPERKNTKKTHFNGLEFSKSPKDRVVVVLPSNWPIFISYKWG